MPSLLPRRAPSDLAAVVVTWAPVFLPGQRSRRPHGSSRGYTWVRCTLRPARLRAHLNERSSGNLVLWVTPHTSLKLPGRAARSRGRTFTGEFQSIHGILSGTDFLATRG